MKRAVTPAPLRLRDWIIPALHTVWLFPMLWVLAWGVLAVAP